MQRPPWENTAPFVKPEAWDRWLANAPESENVEDRSDLDAIDMDEIYWRRARGEKGQLIGTARGCQCGGDGLRNFTANKNHAPAEEAELRLVQEPVAIAAAPETCPPQAVPELV